MYAGFGVKSTWIIDPASREVHVLEGDDERTLIPGERLTTLAVPGLDVEVSALFPTD